MSASQGSSPGKWSFSPFPSFNLPLREPCCPNKLLATKRRTSFNKCNAEKNVVGEQILKRIKIYLKISRILLPSRPYQIKHLEGKKIMKALLSLLAQFTRVPLSRVPSSFKERILLHTLPEHFRFIVWLERCGFENREICVFTFLTFCLGFLARTQRVWRLVVQEQV